jgi:hypothetical protein
MGRCGRWVVVGCWVDVLRWGWAPCISDVTPTGIFTAYLMGVPSMGLPEPLPDLLRLTETPHIPFGWGGGVGSAGGCGRGLCRVGACRYQ